MVSNLLNSPLSMNFMGRYKSEDWAKALSFGSKNKIMQIKSYTHVNNRKVFLNLQGNNGFKAFEDVPYWRLYKIGTQEKSDINLKIDEIPAFLSKQEPNSRWRAWPRVLRHNKK